MCMFGIILSDIIREFVRFRLFTFGLVPDTCNPASTAVDNGRSTV